jgi:hypothetical protein
MRFVLVFVALISTLIARDNPFSSSTNADKEESLIARELSSEPLRPELLRLPIEAVRVKRVIVEYQKVDGTKEKRVFEIEKSIAPDMPLLIRQ